MGLNGDCTSGDLDLIWTFLPGYGTLMTLTDAEFQAVLNDTTKRIDGDIAWRNDEDHSPSVEFYVDVISNAGWPLVVRGSFNPLIPAVSCVLIYKNVGRVYGLDFIKICFDFRTAFCVSAKFGSYAARNMFP